MISGYMPISPGALYTLLIGSSLPVQDCLLIVSGLQLSTCSCGGVSPTRRATSDRATLGHARGGVSGPLKWRMAGARDLVIGMKVAQANGKIT